MVLLYLLLAATFAAGWCLRGSLCTRRGGCDAMANDQIATLEAEILDLRTAAHLRTAAMTDAWARRQGLLP